MVVKSGLRYIKREGFFNFFRRFLIYIILEWYASIFMLKLKKKQGVIVKDILGSKMCLDVRDKGVSRELALMGIREELFTRTLQGALREGDCVLGIGANIGYYALMAARLVGPRGKVYAIEPVPHNMKLLEESVRLNNYENIETFQLAFGQSDSTAKLYLSDHPNWSSFYPPRKVTGIVDITVSSVDSFLKGRRLPDLIRMDVEGYEYEIIIGMNSLLESDIPLRLFIEFHPDIMGRQRADTFLFILKQHRFQLRKVILEPNIYPPHSGFLWRVVDFLNEKQLKLRFGAWDMTLDALMAHEPIMSGKAGDPALFLERDGTTSQPLQ
jgi:FkbM family methyltransferase